MQVHLVDGTYELFRAHFGAPSATVGGRAVGAVRGLLRSMLALLRDDDLSHPAIAFDTEIESFRNALYDGYKTGEGIEPALLSQFPLAEEACEALGMVVWRMRAHVGEASGPPDGFETDDALATMAARAERDPRVTKVVICSPDKDLAQCVRGDRVVRLDRLRKAILDEKGVHARYGFAPASIPDFLALVGDDADGIPGVPRWGEKSASAVLGAYSHLEAIPDDASRWKVKIRGADSLAQSLATHRADARLYKTLATLRIDVPLKETVDDLGWTGAPRERLAAFLSTIGDERAMERVPRWR